jgi:uncharacterized alkaline shock family protein YloU
MIVEANSSAVSAPEESNRVNSRCAVCIECKVQFERGVPKVFQLIQRRITINVQIFCN